MAVGREEWLPSNRLSVFQSLKKPQFLKWLEGIKSPKASHQSFTVFKTHPLLFFPTEKPGGEDLPSPSYKGVLGAQKGIVNWLTDTWHRATSWLIFNPVCLASQQGKHFQRKLPTQVQFPKSQFGHHLGLHRGRNGQVSLKEFTSSFGNKVEIGNGRIIKRLLARLAWKSCFPFQICNPYTQRRGGCSYHLLLLSQPFITN